MRPKYKYVIPNTERPLNCPNCGSHIELNKGTCYCGTDIGSYTKLVVQEYDKEMEVKECSLKKRLEVEAKYEDIKKKYDDFCYENYDVKYQSADGLVLLSFPLGIILAVIISKLCFTGGRAVLFGFLFGVVFIPLLMCLINKYAESVNDERKMVAEKTQELKRNDIEEDLEKAELAMIRVGGLIDQEVFDKICLKVAKTNMGIEFPRLPHSCWH